MTIQLSALNGANGFRILGEAVDDVSGWSVDNAGDVNGDGIDDFIIGAYGASPNGATSGAAYVVFGSSSGFAASINLSALSGANGFQISGAGAGDGLGFAVSSAGDVNGDGIDDVIVGAPLDNSGDAYVLFGKSTGFSANIDLSSLSSSDGFRIAGDATGDLTGYSVSDAGDLNGDGIGDLIVGATAASGTGGAGAGKSYVIFGHTGSFGTTVQVTSLNGSNGFTIVGDSGGELSGQAVASAGDFNGDGVDDIIIGAPYDAAFGSAYVVFGTTNGFGATVNLSAINGSNGVQFVDSNTSDVAGYSAATVGDINGDGLDDIAIGAIGADPGGNASAGSVYVVFGSTSAFGASFDLSNLNGANGFVVNGADAQDQLGVDVSLAGDVNGDGLDDFIVGAFLDDPNATDNAGSAFLIFGQAGGFSSAIDVGNLAPWQGVALNGVNMDDNAGGSVASADVNNDGFTDLIIGALGSDASATDAGTTYVVYGSVAFGATSTSTVGDDFIVTGGAADSISGQAGNDLIRSRAGNDTLNGGNDNDTLEGGAGADVLRGGSGSDWASYEGSGSGVFVRLGTNQALSGHAQGDTFNSIENIIGSLNRDILIGDTGGNQIVGAAGNDDLWGLQGNDTLVGNSGNDLLTGAANNDSIDGGTGDDTLSGGTGADALNGGEGRDMAEFYGAANGIFLRLDTGVGSAGQATGDTYISVEDIHGTDHRDIIIGSASDNMFIGESGDDDLYGLNGNDSLLGGGGNDNIFGQNDNDTLIGGDGADTLSGGGGDDLFVFALGDDADVITDFTAGAATEDVINLSGFGAAFDTFAEVITAASQSGADVIIDFGGGDLLTLQNVTVGSLHASDFTFS